MQDLLDVSIPAVVLIPLFLVCFAVWRCFHWIVQSNEYRRAEFIRFHRLAKEEQERAERDYEQGYISHQEYLRQRPGGQQRQVDDHRVEYRSQPAAGYDYPRRVQLEQDYRYADSLNYPSRHEEENMRRRRWDEERRRAEAEEFRIKQTEEYNYRKHVKAEELRMMQVRAEEAERFRKEAAEAELRKILAEEAVKKRIAEEEARNRRQAEEEERMRQDEELKRRRRQAEEDEKRRKQFEVDESNKKAELEAQAKKMAEEEVARKKETGEITQKETQDNEVYTKVQPSSNLKCIVCQKQTKRRCARCKGVFYCSRDCQVQHWNEGHKYHCRTLESSSSPGSSESSARKFSDVLSPRSSRSDEIIAPLLSPALSPAIVDNNSALSHSAPVSPRPGSLLKTSSTVSADGRRLKPKKVLFPYDDFVELFNTDITFIPCGLINCGNSCFANAVLQCLTYTQPLVAYLLRGDHSRQCRSSVWCFMCSLQEHAMKVKHHRSPFSPVDIVLHLKNIGRGLGYGKQEDAHEFMSYAIHLMQKICLDEVGGEEAVDACTQETTLIHHIFGGLLQSQVRCMQCRHESNSFEIMMDLAVEIQGNVGSLEDALRQFTTPEILDGENKYKCDRYPYDVVSEEHFRTDMSNANRCDAYVEARKQITIHEAPNILIVTLKRFKAGRFGKLNKQVAFSEVLDLTPYMSVNGNRPSLYTLYAVVVHVDVDALNAAYYGHYICLVKNPSGFWYRVDDPKVTEVDIYRVTSQQAYMLLYKRSNSRPMEFSKHILRQTSPVAQDWFVSNRFEMRPEPYQFPLHMNPLVSSTRIDRTDFVHVPIGVSNC